MEKLASYQKRIIFLLLLIIFSGLLLKIIDRQHRAIDFDLAGFLDGYRYSTTIDTAKASIDVSTNADILPTNKTNAILDDTKINVNTADAIALQQLPGIGPVLAQRLIAYRDSIGGYVYADELLDVKGIGKKKLEKIKEYLEF
jgi:competence ComEA-like helix-hairpin-helix protein